ncbi:MAG: site-specific DNA-methyltransferase [Muribaculum sp.]|nr:site-specific DNA-methyltransferase [Muribaculum sp.]
MDAPRHKYIIGDCREMKQIPSESVHLIVTSPPYWQLKDNGVDSQIGFGQTYEDYINSLNMVWLECFRTLKPGCRLCINIGDQFARAAYYGRYKIVPIHSEIIRFCETIGFDYMGSIIWQKQTNMHTSGGGKVMGSFPYPKGGVLKVDYENILIFKKLGKSDVPEQEVKETSILTMEEWETFFNTHWTFCGDKQNKHIAIFPEELPYRLIRMFSFSGDVVLDPFMGSGTTALAALKNGRSAVGYELNPDFFKFYGDKVLSKFPHGLIKFEKIDDRNGELDIEYLKARLPYIYIDVSKLKRNDVAAKNSYGSVNSISQRNFEDLEEVPLFDNVPNMLANQATVLINLVSAVNYEQMLSSGISYVRIGEVKGSLTVTPGFAQLSYILLHTAGTNSRLFKLNKKGSFQIWTRETLVKHGFSPKSAPYYAVLKFRADNPIHYEKIPCLLMKKGTYVAKILPIEEFGLF